ncbi:retrovirus-related pol polyprotein from transposon TNT 1-94 [Tanacetum coccineum]
MSATCLLVQVATCVSELTFLAGSELALASYRGKENGIYILQSIDHGPFELGTTRDTLGTTPEGVYNNYVLQGLPKLLQVINHINLMQKLWDNVKMLLAGSELTKEDRESQLYDEFKRFKMLPGENINEYYVRFHKLVNDMRNIRMTMPNIQLNSKFVNNMSPEWVAGNGGAQNRAGNANAGQGKLIKCYNCNGLGHIARNCTQPKRPHNSNYFKDKMLLMQAQENGAVLDEEELLFLAGEQTNTFDADVDNQPVRDLALNEDNIFQAYECDAFDSDVDDEPIAQSIFMANLSSAGPANLKAGPSNASILSKITVIDSTSADMGNSNVIPYEQYLTINDVFVVPSSASSVPNDAYVLHDNDAYVPTDPLATELNIYKEQVAIYEQRAKFELTLRERKMDELMSILIRDRNKKEENLKKELHYVKLQLNSTIQNNKIIEETVNALKQEFKQKETKFLTDFSNLKNIKDKLENKLYSQDQSIQTVHMMLKPTKLYDQDTETVTHHVPVTITSSEEDLELAETIRIKMNEKMIDSVYIVDFMIIEDISSIIDPRLTQVVLRKPFIEISNMSHDQQEGVVRFVNINDEVSYKMPYKIEQYNSLSNLEKEHTKSVYLRNEEEKRRGVEYVMSKIIGFYKECLELGLEYLIGVEDEGEVT